MINAASDTSSEAPLADSLSAADAHNQAMALPTTAVIQQLIDILGATTVATIGGPAGTANRSALTSYASPFNWP